MKQQQAFSAMNVSFENPYTRFCLYRSNGWEIVHYRPQVYNEPQNTTCDNRAPVSPFVFVTFAVVLEWTGKIAHDQRKLQTSGAHDE